MPAGPILNTLPSTTVAGGNVFTRCDRRVDASSRSQPRPAHLVFVRALAHPPTMTYAQV